MPQQPNETPTPPPTDREQVPDRNPDPVTDKQRTPLSPEPHEKKGSGGFPRR